MMAETAVSTKTSHLFCMVAGLFRDLRLRYKAMLVIDRECEERVVGIGNDWISWWVPDKVVNFPNLHARGIRDTKLPSPPSPS